MDKPKILNEEVKTENTEFDLKKSFELLKNNFNRDNRTQESISTVPTYTPKSFLEQFVLYDDDTDQRLYVYVNGSWKYVNLS